MLLEYGEPRLDRALAQLRGGRIGAAGLVLLQLDEFFLSGRRQPAANHRNRHARSIELTLTRVKSEPRPVATPAQWRAESASSPGSTETSAARPARGSRRTSRSQRR